jgi:succinyl-CoA synthetase beta subunit
MMILEHEAKDLLRSVGVAVPDGSVIRPGPRALQAAVKRVAAYPVAVKAQVRSGGRGKRGGVIRANDSAQLRAAARQLFATTFGDEKPAALLADPWLAIDRELYLSVTVDGAAEGYVVLYSPRGGVDIESGTPPARYAVGVPWRFRTHELRAVLEPVEKDFQVRERVIALAQRLVETAAARDCTTIEVNPLARLASGDLVALDTKVVYDEWGHFRNGDIAHQRAGIRRRADRLLKACLDMQHMYVRLDGDIGLISGGAGMTMAAMDMIRQYGGHPACFFDCSPGPTSTRGYRPAIAMLDADPRVKVILVSIFGGGTQMQRVANAMKENMPMRRSTKPMVFRLDGTHVDQVPAILATFGAQNHDCLEDAVREAVRLARRA